MCNSNNQFTVLTKLTASHFQVNLAIFVVLLRVIFTKISTKYQTDNVEKTKSVKFTVIYIYTVVCKTKILISHRALLSIINPRCNEYNREMFPT